MLPRFFAPALDPASPDVALGEDEAKHLSRVMRLGAGDRVEVFDGRGRQFEALVLRASGREAVVRLEAAVENAPEPGVPFTLAQALLKGDKMDACIRDATMLGARRIVPVVSAHVAVKHEAIARGRPEERWRRVALAAVKQCRRGWLPEIGPPRSFDAWLADERPAGCHLMLVEPSIASAATRTMRSLFALPRPDAATLAIGPEGGWSRPEVDAAVAHGFEPITLGPLTLRADAVPVAAISMFRMLWE